MRPIGHVLMWVGFLAAAFVATRQADVINWTYFAGTAMIGVVGVVLLRRTAGAAASQVDTVRTNIATLERTLGELVKTISGMNAEKVDIFVYDVHERIDSELAPNLAGFAEARESMIHALGLQEYAGVMDHFARGERFVNRAWSASADGYVDEVWSSMATAEEALREADNILRGHLQAKRG